MLALVWKRVDFSETSRLVTLVTRDAGRVTALAKGAHRANSPFLGRLDLLNLVDATFAARRRDDGLRLLMNVVLVHEPRELRVPARFLCANHLLAAFDAAFVAGRVDTALFDVLHGATVVLERCPAQSLATVLVGLELRLLATLGGLPTVDTCSDCNDPRVAFLAQPGPRLVCARHAAPGSRALAHRDRDWLVAAAHTPARQWNGLAAPSRAAIALVGEWLEATLERGLRHRRTALAAATALAATTA